MGVLKASLIVVFAGMVFSAPLSALTNRQIKETKILFDLVKKQAGQATIQDDSDCRNPGEACATAADCCGSAACNASGLCEIQMECKPYGGACDDSLDCCGSSFCEDKFCH